MAGSKFVITAGADRRHTLQVSNLARTMPRHATGRASAAAVFRFYRRARGAAELRLPPDSF